VIDFRCRGDTGSLCLPRLTIAGAREVSDGWDIAAIGTTEREVRRRAIKAGPPRKTAFFWGGASVHKSLPTFKRSKDIGRELLHTDTALGWRPCPPTASGLLSTQATRDG
jgi:hypothetical protein